MADFILEGANRLEANFLTISTQAMKQIATAFYLEAQVNMAESKKRVPVDTGALRDSGFVDKPEFDGNKLSVKFGYGGGDVDYAIVVHEDLQAIHKVGQAKYLESVIMESAPYLLERVAERINLDSRAA